MIIIYQGKKEDRLELERLAIAEAKKRGFKLFNIQMVSRRRKKIVEEVSQESSSDFFEVIDILEKQYPNSIVEISR